jgi:hypothetical protein
MSKWRQVSFASGSPESENRGGVFRYQLNTFRRNFAFSDNSFAAPFASSRIFGATLNVCLFAATRWYLKSCEHTQQAHNVREVSSEMAIGTAY